MDSIEIQEAKAFFAHEAIFYLFILRYMDGRERLNMLGVSRIHFVDELRAKKWRDETMAKLQPADRFTGTDIVYDAEQKLERIYRHMTGR